MSVPTEPGYYWARVNSTLGWIPIEFLPCAGDPVIMFFGEMVDDHAGVKEILETWEFGPTIEPPGV